MDLRNLSNEEFFEYLDAKVSEFKKAVAQDECYQFARDGETLGLGDWFEQFACHTGFM